MTENKINKKTDKLCLRFTPGYTRRVFYKHCTLKQVGHMVMLTSGSRERKYSHLSGLGQRLIRTSLLLIERSTERLTLTGTKFEPPCCLDRYINTSALYYGPCPFTLSSWWNINRLIFSVLSYLEAHFGCKWVFFFIVQTIIYP